MPKLFLNLCLAFVLFAGTALEAGAQSAQSEKRLENLLDKVDTQQSWQNVPVSGQPQNAAPRPSPEPGMSRAAMSAAQLGSTLRNSFMWHDQAGQPPSPPSYGSSSWSSSAYVPQGVMSPNPFNLSPFGVLHYLWDPTTYVSSSNPIALTDVRNELQQAEHYSEMAQSAATRAKYATTAQERQQAAAQANEYAQLSQQAASQAQQISEGSSSNPAEVAALAQQQATQARQMASQAAASAGNRW